MKRIHKMLMFAAFSAMIFAVVSQGAEGERIGRLRGTFIGLTEREVGERGYTGIVVKPLDSDEHVTLLLPPDRERLVQAAQRLQEGQQMGISFVTEDGQKWIEAIEFERRIREGDERSERTIVRREIRQAPEEVERQRQNREERALRPAREAEREPLRGREGREPRRQPPYPERIDAQLREIVEGNMDRMHRALREVFMVHFERTEAELRELRAHVENMERQMQELRAENERLRMQLRERGRMQIEEIEIRERREPDRPREGGLRNEREVLRERDRGTDLDRPAEDRPRNEREAPRDNGERK